MNTLCKFSIIPVKASTGGTHHPTSEFFTLCNFQRFIFNFFNCCNLSTLAWRLFPVLLCVQWHSKLLISRSTFGILAKWLKCAAENEWATQRRLKALFEKLSGEIMWFQRAILSFRTCTHTRIHLTAAVLYGVTLERFTAVKYRGFQPDLSSRLWCESRKR